MTTATLAPTTTSATASYGEVTAALKAARTAIGAKYAAPAMRGVLLEHNDYSDLTFTGYDFTTAVTASADAQGTGTLKVLVQADKLAAVLAGMAKGTTAAKIKALPVTFTPTAEADTLAVTVDGFTFDLPTLDTDDYPAIPQVDRDATEPSAIVTTTTTLLEALARTVPFAGDDMTLPMLTGVKLEAEHWNQTLTLATTDRYRLAVAPVTATITGAFAALAPARPLHTVAKLLPTDHEVLLSTSRTHLHVRSGNVRASFTLIDAEFPRYRSLLPTADALAAVFTVSTPTLAKAAARVGTVADRSVRLEVTGDGITLEAGDVDGGKARSPWIPAIGEHVPDLPVRAIDPKRLTEVLALFPTIVAMGVPTAPNRPILFAETVEALTDPTAYRHLVMPFRLS